jgi:hypothetical protein
MVKFVKFLDSTIPTSGVTIGQDVFVNPDYVRVVRADPHGGTLIQLDRQEISVKEDVAKVIQALL